MKDKMEKKLTPQSLPQSVQVAIDNIQAKKGQNIVILDLRGKSSFTDYFVIVHGNTSRQNMAICESTEKRLKEENLRAIGIEGTESAEWILMDYGSFVIHIFSERAYEYYSLDKLWGDSPKLYC
ncbi:ribosome silencing factor [bacterium]|nr:ribosome silencing factor [bacterium]